MAAAATGQRRQTIMFAIVGVLFVAMLVIYVPKLLGGGGGGGESGTTTVTTVPALAVPAPTAAPETAPPAIVVPADPSQARNPFDPAL